MRNLVSCFTIAVTSFSFTYAHAQNEKAIEVLAHTIGQNIAEGEAVMVEGGMACIVNDAGKRSDPFLVVFHDEYPVWNNSIVTDYGNDGTVVDFSQTVFLSSASVICGENRSEFVFLKLAQEADSVQFSDKAFFMLPLRAMEDQTEASEYIEEIASDAWGENHHLECYDPEWIGSNGQQCCGFALALGSNISSCKSKFWMMVSACVPAALAAGGGMFAWCARHCVLPPPLIPPCLKACLIAGGITTIGTITACIAGADFAYADCVKSQWAQYWRDLANSGCKMIMPDGYADE